MEVKHILQNKNFVGRQFELKKISEISNSNEASILVVYGRRRVGKTELIEQGYRSRNLLKFEGIEGESEADQMQHFLIQLSKYTQDPYIAKLNLTTWIDIFQLLAEHTKKGTWTIFFDELQWLANYKNRLIAELKYIWDNHFRHNKSLILVLCGSSPSFMVNKVIHSKALYNRSQHEILLDEFSPLETKSFLDKNRSLREVMDAYLTIGGIPEYLKYLSRESSVFLGLCKNSFTSDSFFSKEYERIFTSSLGSNKNYRKIIEFLSRIKFAERNTIAKHIKCLSGGTLTNLLDNLDLCSFVTKYSPFNLDEKSLLKRYNINDQYLQFYFKFIEPLLANIQRGNYNSNFTQPINMDTYNKWLGFSFERFCRKHHKLIAHILGFESISYNAGAFFNRSTSNLKEGYQIDLVFDRADKVYTVCEIKYLQTPATRKIISDFEKKLELFPNARNRTIQKVLITSEGADKQVINEHYFDRIITLHEMFI